MSPVALLYDEPWRLSELSALVRSTVRECYDVTDALPHGYVLCDATPLRLIVISWGVRVLTPAPNQRYELVIKRCDWYRSRPSRYRHGLRLDKDTTYQESMIRLTICWGNRK